MNDWKSLSVPRGDDAYDDGTGIEISWSPSRQLLGISGTYDYDDSICQITGEQMTLCEFFTVLGITEVDCRKAFRDSFGRPVEQ